MYAVPLECAVTYPSRTVATLELELLQETLLLVAFDGEMFATRLMLSPSYRVVEV